VIDRATAEKPFRLVAAPARTFLHSTFTETSGSLARERRPTALMNPDDCVALGVAEGDRVTLGNERGVVVAHARPREGQQRGVVVVEGIWPNKHFEGGIGINALTSAEPGYRTGSRVSRHGGLGPRSRRARCQRHSPPPPPPAEDQPTSLFVPLPRRDARRSDGGPEAIGGSCAS
jgi:anaerobic selenocysteine-containing dehydrogenase